MSAATLLPACRPCQHGRHEDCAAAIAHPTRGAPTPCQCYLDRHDSPTQLDLFTLLEGDPT